MNIKTQDKNVELKRPFIIAIDGHSSCGKSTIAKDLAKALDFIYIDTGAMYRAITLLVLKHKIQITDSDKINKILENIQMEFKKEGNETVLFLNDINVEKEIRTPAVAALVSPVSEISAIRRKLVDLQRKMSLGHNVILEGRDIATIVFPDADIKFFVTADLEKRTERRFKELKEKGTPLPIDDVRKNLATRDDIDSNREDSPLTKAADAIVIDTTNHSRKSQLELVLSYVEDRISIDKK